MIQKCQCTCCARHEGVGIFNELKGSIQGEKIFELQKKLNEQSDLLAKCEDVLDVVVQRHETIGGDARKLGVPLGIAVICRDALTAIREFRKAQEG